MTYAEPERVKLHLRAVAGDRPPRFHVEDFDTLKPGSLQWRVKGLWPAVGVCFVGGPSMSGKSFWTLDALAKVVRGDDVLGRKSIPGGVVYVAAEGAHGVRNRIAGLRSRIGDLGGGFKFIGQAPDLRDPSDVAELRARLIETADAMHTAGHTLGVVVVDTLSAAIPGADENSAKDMSPVLHALQELAADLAAVVVVVAHTGKDETRGLRGWSGLLGNADGLIMLEDPAGQLVRSGTVVKVKDGKSGDTFAFSLEVVTIGQDDDGDDVTTCVIQPEDAPERPRKGRKSSVAETHADLIRQAFNRILPEQGARILAAGALNAEGVRVEALRTEALRLGVGPTEPDYAELTLEEGKGARRRWQQDRSKAFDRALKHLLASGSYRVESDWFWEATGRRSDPDGR